MKTFAILAALCLVASHPVWAESPKPSDEGCMITLKGNGETLVYDSVVSAEQLSNTLASLAAADPNQRITVRTEGKTEYKQVVGLIDLCRAAKLTNIGFAERSK